MHPGEFGAILGAVLLVWLVTFEVTLRAFENSVSHAPRYLAAAQLRRDFMGTYISLMNWTDKGIGQFKNTVERAEAAKQLARESSAGS